MPLSSEVCDPRLTEAAVPDAAARARDMAVPKGLAVGVLSAAQQALQAEYEDVGLSVFLGMAPGDFAVIGDDNPSSGRFRLERSGNVAEDLTTLADYPEGREPDSARVDAAEDAQQNLAETCATAPHDADDASQTPLTEEEVAQRLVLQPLSPESIGLSCDVVSSVAGNLRSRSETRDAVSVLVVIASAAEFESSEACSGALDDVYCIAYSPQSAATSERYLEDWLNGAGCLNVDTEVALSDVGLSIESAREAGS